MQKKNFVYSLVLTLCNYLASFIVFPYVTRVLGASGLGRIEFVNEMTNYFMLFSMLGVNAIGTREIAACKDYTRRSKVFSSILSVSLLFTLTITVIFFICVFTIPSFKSDKSLFLISSAHIIFTVLQVEWLYRGIENFKYITIRSVLIRVVFIICVFLFIRTPDHYVRYFILTILVVLANSIINFLYSRSFVSCRISVQSLFDGLIHYAKPIATLGVNNIMNSFYSTFNVVFLGLVVSKTEVGYYYVSNKIMTLSLGVVSAFTLVMLPRMSSLKSSGDDKEYNRLINKSLSLIIDVCVPLSVVLFCYAPDIVAALTGPGFERAIIPLRCIAPIVLINAIAQILVFQIEMPNHRDTAILTASIIGAFIGVLLNILIVKDYGVYGSAIVLFVSVLSTFIYNFYYCTKEGLLSFPYLYFFKIVLFSIPYAIIYIVLYLLGATPLSKLVIGGSLSGLIWLLINHKKYINFRLLK